jgi:hypothetical protein
MKNLVDKPCVFVDEVVLLTFNPWDIDYAIIA